MSEIRRAGKSRTLKEMYSEIAKLDEKCLAAVAEIGMDYPGIFSDTNLNLGWRASLMRLMHRVKYIEVSHTELISLSRKRNSTVLSSSISYAWLVENATPEMIAHVRSRLFEYAKSHPDEFVMIADDDGNLLDAAFMNKQDARDWQDAHAPSHPSIECETESTNKDWGSW